MKQSDLANAVGISPSYLNLIEHNKRRIGGKLLMDLARKLDIDASALTEGAELALLTGLREAAAGGLEAVAELDKSEEFIGRFPGWAELVAAQTQRIAALERTVEILTDRLTHDPFLSTSLHEVLSAVTAIRSTSAILVESDDIEPEWQARFERNLFEDAVRLTEGAQSLVAYLDGAGDAETSLTSPQEEVEAFLEARNYHLPDLEERTGRPEELIKSAREFSTAPARELALMELERYARDARAMPLVGFRAAAQELAFEPAKLAARFHVDVVSVFRRLASLPLDDGEERIGLVICDGSGTLTFRKPVDGFPVPRFGAACPLWPLYQALARPMAPLRQVIELAGRSRHKFLTYAISHPKPQDGFDAPQVFEAAMLIVPASRMDFPDLDALSVGTSCRICPQENCTARRESSILTDGF